VTGIDLFSAGDVQGRDGDDIWTSLDPLSGHYRRLLVRENRLCGVLLLGDCASAAALTERLNTPEPPQAGWLFDSFTAQPAAAGIPKMTKPTLVVVGHGMVGHHF
jgi:nitrite reductase (NADH) large subunit